MKYITPANQLANRRSVHPSQRQHHVTPVTSPLHVVTAITNPQRYYARYKLYQAFEKMCADAGVTLWTIELALRDRHHEVTCAGHPNHIQLRSPAELWHKENLLNIAISRLPEDWEYVAWIDADVTFARPDWATETVHQLQHYHMVQMWSHAQDVSSNWDLGTGKCLSGPHQSFLCSYVNGTQFPKYLADCNPGGSGSSGTGAGRDWHSGYAWAARRSAFSDLGGLGDIALLGSADHHMAAALIGKVERTIHGQMQQSYKDYWARWQARAEKYVKRNVGFVPGLLLHNWHGPKVNRRYVDRWRILVDEKYDYREDIKYDPQGVLQLTDSNRVLRDKLRAYFAQRREDELE